MTKEETEKLLNDENIEWRPIPDYEDYLVSDTGLIYSKYTKRILKGAINCGGYKTISLIKNEKKYTKLVHRLIAQAFIPNPANKPQVNHIDGNKLNNCVENLEWVTHSENMKHAYNTGLNSNKLDFSEMEIETIRYLYSSGKYTQKKLAEMFNVSRGTIGKIVKDIITQNKTDLKKITPEMHSKIVKLYKTGNYSQKDIAKNFNVHKTTISRHLKKEGLTQKKEKITLKDRNDIANMYLTGNYSQKRLAEIFNVTKGAIHYHLKKANILSN